MEHLKMDETINIVGALRKEVERLKAVLARDIRVGDTYPGKSQIEGLKTLIDQLEREIEGSAHRR
jgi:hypothetical protein